MYTSQEKKMYKKYISLSYTLRYNRILCKPKIVDLYNTMSKDLDMVLNPSLYLPKNISVPV